MFSLLERHPRRSFVKFNDLSFFTCSYFISPDFAVLHPRMDDQSVTVCRIVTEYSTTSIHNKRDFQNKVIISGCGGSGEVLPLYRLLK